MAKKKATRNSFETRFPKKFSNKLLSIVGFILLLLIILLLTRFMSGYLNGSSSEKNGNNRSNRSVKSLYASDDIFKHIPLKERQIDLSLTTSDGHPYFQKKLRKELERNSELISMKCMPEQVYINRDGYKYAILQVDSPAYKEVQIHDPKLLDIISRLDQKMPGGYRLSQLLVCNTSDNRSIIKYNSIIKKDTQEGYTTTLNPTAFVSQILPNGDIQDVSYITIGERSFCRFPIQLTRNNLFYLACDSYYGENGTGEIKDSYIYRSDLNNLTFKQVSHCTFNNSEPPICENN